MTHRKKPFSAAQKKKQLQEKRKKKRLKEQKKASGGHNSSNQSQSSQQPQQNVNTSGRGSRSRMRHDKTVNFLELVSNSSDAQQLRTLFRREPDDVLQARKQWARQPLGDRSELKPRVLKRFKSVDFPVRPPWHESFQKQKIESREEKYFVDYVHKLYATYGERLNHFEHNLEVWRQLWRVLEFSDMFLLVADIRHPLFHFPTSLYDHITAELKKPFILLLNKCDLVSREVQKRWVGYFKEHFPKVHICLFTSFNEDESAKPSASKRKQKKKRGLRKKPDYSLVAKLWEKCKEINPVDEVEPESFDVLIQKALAHGTNGGDEEEDASEHLKREDRINVPSSSDHKHVTIGLIGHPNVGKSCVLNALVGKHVVSASYTPGFTKHFQTFFVHEKIKLCDSPGLVFPAVDMPKQLQVLCGIFPIAQVREPYSAIHYLAQRVRVEEILKLPFPKDALDEGQEEDSSLWSGWLICVAYAEKYKLTTKRGRYDEYRAANKILRDVLYGNILLSFEPPDDVEYEVAEEEFEKMSAVPQTGSRYEHSSDDSSDEAELSDEERREEDLTDEEDSSDEEDQEDPNHNAFMILQDSEDVMM